MPRSAAGTYSLPAAANRPVASGTVINSTAQNALESDISTELTNSLDRAGRGAMTAQLKLSDGTLATPGIGFNSETGSGWFRNAAADVRLAVNGILRAAFNAVGHAWTAATADGASAIAFTYDTTTALANATAKIASWKTGGTEKMALRSDGASLSPVADGATAVGFIYDTANALATVGAKLASYRVAGVERVYIDKDGSIAGSTVQASGTLDGGALTAGTNWGISGSYVRKAAGLGVLYATGTAAAGASFSTIATIPSGSRPRVAQTGLIGYVHLASTGFDYVAQFNISTLGVIAMAAYDNGGNLVAPPAPGTNDLVILAVTYDVA